ncbi:MAG: alpha/beta hydrolase [Bacteroidota bacterium]
MKRIIQVFVFLLILVIAIPVAAVYFRPNLIINKQDAKKELSDPASHFITWRGAEIHYTDEGSGFPLLMIHGFGGNYRNFQSLSDLMKNDYRVIRIDLPGFGLSDFPTVKENEDYITDYREYLGFILDTLHLDSVYVIGNSMGGGVTWMMAGDHHDKVKKIVLLDAAGYDTENVANKLAMFKFKSVRSAFDKGMPLFMSESGMAKGYADDLKINQAEVALNNKFTNREGNIRHMLNLATASKFPDSALIPRVQCPALIVWGKQDEIIPLEHAERFKRDIKNSRVVVYDTCGHMPMMELPERTQADIEQFFKN